MEKRDLKRLILNIAVLEKQIRVLKDKGLIKIQPMDSEEIRGHIDKAKHNLRFVYDNLKLEYYDWCITGCYYAIYHSALALLLKKGYSSKNHDATLCLLIKEYYNRGVNPDDLELINQFFLDYQDLIFYVTSKKKREESSYSSKYLFDKEAVELLRQQTIAFINKAEYILQNKEVLHE